MRKMIPKVKATKLTETAGCTTWMIEWIYPAMSGRQGKSYRVTTYPNSDLIFLETAAKRRKVATGVAIKIMPQIRAALAAVS